MLCRIEFGKVTQIQMIAVPEMFHPINLGQPNLYAGDWWNRKFYHCIVNSRVYVVNPTDESVEEAHHNIIMLLKRHMNSHSKCIYNAVNGDHLHDTRSSTCRATQHLSQRITSLDPPWCAPPPREGPITWVRAILQSPTPDERGSRIPLRVLLCHTDWEDQWHQVLMSVCFSWTQVTPPQKERHWYILSL